MIYKYAGVFDVSKIFSTPSIFPEFFLGRGGGGEGGQKFSIHVIMSLVCSFVVCFLISSFKDGFERILQETLAVSVVYFQRSG